VLKIIDVFVCKLRKKLAQATGGNRYIRTVWGRGSRSATGLGGRARPRRAAGDVGRLVSQATQTAQAGAV